MRVLKTYKFRSAKIEILVYEKVGRKIIFKWGDLELTKADIVPINYIMKFQYGNLRSINEADNLKSLKSMVYFSKKQFKKSAGIK